MSNPIYKPWEVYFHDHFNWMFIELAAMPGDSILEIGASSGFACNAIKARYPRKLVVASDVNKKCCKMMADRFRYWQIDIPVVNCDGFDLPFPDNYFNVCFSVGVLEHFEKEDTLQLLREQLRVAGYVIVDIPIKAQDENYGDERIWSAKEWIEMCDSVGNIIHQFYRTGETYGIVIKHN